MLRAYHELEPRIQAERYRRYREVLAPGRAARWPTGWAGAGAGARGFLPESLPSWPPFPDTNDALAG